MMPTVASIHVNRAEWNETISGPQSAVSQASRDSYRPAQDAPLFMTMAAGCGLGIWAAGPYGCAVGALVSTMLGCDSDFRLQAEPTPEVTPPSPPDPEKCEEVTITVDCDGDGYTNTFSVCEDDAWVVASACGGQTLPSDEEDCAPQNPEAYPGAPEIACSGADENCDGVGDQVWYDMDKVTPQASLSAAEAIDPEAVEAVVQFEKSISHGDLNSDGANDLVVSSQGKVHLYYGPVASDAKEDVMMSLPESAVYDPILPVLDFDGDGDDDLVVGTAISTDGNISSALFIIQGPLPSGTTSVDVAQYSALTFIGPSGGLDVSPVGDLNFDGRDDLVITDDNDDRDFSYIIYGRNFPVEPATVTLSEDVTRLNSDSLLGSYSIETTYAPFDRVIGAGDFNNDGYGDILITGGTVTDNDERLVAAHLLYGPFSMGSGHVLDESNTGIFELDEAEKRDTDVFFPQNSLAGLGDVNGDGFDDVLVGFPLIDVEQNPDVGLAYLMLGASDLYGMHYLHDVAVTLVPPTDIADSEKTTVGFASIVAPIGDINDDFLADTAIYVYDLAKTDCLPENIFPYSGLMVLYGTPFSAEELKGQSRSVEDLAGTIYYDSSNFVFYNSLISARIYPKGSGKNPGLFDGNPLSLLFPSYAEDTVNPETGEVQEYPYRITVFNHVNP